MKSTFKNNALKKSTFKKQLSSLLTPEEKAAVRGITDPRERDLMLDFASWPRCETQKLRLLSKAFHDMAYNIVAPDGNTLALAEGPERVKVLTYLRTVRNAALRAARAAGRIETR